MRAVRRCRLASLGLLVSLLAVLGGCTTPEVPGARPVGPTPSSAPAPAPPGTASLLTGGPLVGVSRSLALQARADVLRPVFLGGSLTLVNRSAQPVTIVDIQPWEEQRMTLGHVVVIQHVPGQTPIVGFSGGNGAASLEERVVGFAGWEQMVPMRGAVVPPCCDVEVLVGLEVVPEPTATTGSFRGLVITYRLADDRVFVTWAPAGTGFCTAALDDPACRANADAVRAQHRADDDAGPTHDQLKDPGTWHG